MSASFEPVGAPGPNQETASPDRPPDARVLLDHLPEAVFAVSTAGTVLSWNLAASRIFGYQAEEIVGRPVAQLVGASSALERATERACRDEVHLAEIDVRARRRDGAEIDLEAAIASAPGAIAVVTARDVSTWKQQASRAYAEQAVTRAMAQSDAPEEVFQRVLTAVAHELGFAYAALWTRHPARNELICTMTWHTPDPAVRDFAAASREVQFASGDGMPGRVWQSLEPVWIESIADDADFPRARAAQAAGLESAVAVPIVVGSELFGALEFLSRARRASDAAVLRTLFAIASDLGQYLARVRAEADLRTSEQRFRILAESAPDAIITMNGRSEITFANPAVELIFGYPPSRLIGRRMTILMPKRFRAAHRAGVRRYLATGQKRIPWSAIELVGLHSSGREVPIEVSFGSFFQDGEPVFTGVIRDISERREQRDAIERTAAELQAAVAQLEQRTAEAEAASRSKSEFLAAMSHELRTPLQAIIGYTALIIAGLGGPLTEDQREKLARVQLSAEHLLQLIDQVLDVARAEARSLSVRLEPIDLNGVADEACALVRPLAEAKALALSCGHGEDASLGSVRADAQRVRQVLINLLTNAVKFTDAGRIDVSTEIDDAVRAALVHVDDTGVGMPPEEIGRIFQPFYQTEAAAHKRAPGIGLGLSISLRLAQAMGGTIRVKSEPGQGSRFTLVLPLTV